MAHLDFFVHTGRRPPAPAILSPATKLEIAATVLCGIAALVWVAAAMSAIAFRHQVALNASGAASQVTYVELPRVVVVGQRYVTEQAGQAGQVSIRTARVDGSAPQSSLANEDPWATPAEAPSPARGAAQAAGSAMPPTTWLKPPST